MILDTESRNPRIVAISYRGLSRLIKNVSMDYEGRIDVTIINELFEDAADIAQRYVSENKVDAFLSAGANGAYLKDTFGIPVVRVPITGVDLMRALLKARQISEHVAVVTYRERNSELEEIKELISLDIEQRTYTTIDDAKETFRELAYQGFRVIVGSSLPVALAEAEGLTGFLVYSRNSVRQAIEDTIEIANIRLTEKQRTERINTILGHLNEGVVAVDNDQRIQMVNPAMETLTGLSTDDAPGCYLNKVAPELSLRNTLKSKCSDLEKVEKIKGKTLIVNRLPIWINGNVNGAVVTVQDAKSISRVDRHIRSRNRYRKFAAHYDFSRITGESSAIRKVRDLCVRYARTESTVLLTGETGTGKELFAQGIHNASNRRKAPFVAMNCAAIPESLLESELFGYEEGAFTGSRKGGQSGLFEMAHTGTIFLDEIAEMPVTLQTRLLRVLQEKTILPLGGDPIPVDVRVVAASNCSLKEAVAEGSLRPDLYYRLNILQVRVPPLRERGDDILLIARQHMTNRLEELNRNRDTTELMELVSPYLTRYTWPGNVRELENVTERLAVMYADSQFGVREVERWMREMVPEFFEISGQSKQSVDTETGTLKEFVQRTEHKYIRRVINDYQGNVSEAARQLGLSRTTLWRKLRNHEGQTTVTEN
jgi:propionate catabolism operon transcriptional regulator